MQSVKMNYKDEIRREIDDLTSEKAKDVLEFICFNIPVFDFAEKS